MWEPCGNHVGTMSVGQRYLSILVTSEAATMAGGKGSGDGFWPGQRSTNPQTPGRECLLKVWWQRDQMSQKWNNEQNPMTLAFKHLCKHIYVNMHKQFIVYKYKINILTPLRGSISPRVGRFAMPWIVAVYRPPARGRGPLGRAGMKNLEPANSKRCFGKWLVQVMAKLTTLTPRKK
jgi:hypothetical protein